VVKHHCIQNTAARIVLDIVSVPYPAAALSSALYLSHLLTPYTLVHTRYSQDKCLLCPQFPVEVSVMQHLQCGTKSFLKFTIALHRLLLRCILKHIIFLVLLLIVPTHHLPPLVTAHASYSALMADYVHVIVLYCIVLYINFLTWPK